MSTHCRSSLNQSTATSAKLAIIIPATSRQILHITMNACHAVSWVHKLLSQRVKTLAKTSNLLANWCFAKSPNRVHVQLNTRHCAPLQPCCDFFKAIRLQSQSLCNIYHNKLLKSQNETIFFDSVAVMRDYDGGTRSGRA